MSGGRRFRFPDPCLAALAVVMAASVASCHRDTRPQDAATQTILRVGLGLATTTNPVEGIRGLSDNLSVEGLVRTGEDGRLQPWLADSWSVQADGASVRIRL